MKNILTSIFTLTVTACFSQSEQLKEEESALVKFNKSESVVYIDGCGGDDQVSAYDVHPNFKLTFLNIKDGVELYVIQKGNVVDEAEFVNKVKEDCKDGQLRECFITDQYISFSKDVYHLSEEDRKSLNNQLIDYLGSYKKFTKN